MRLAFWRKRNTITVSQLMRQVMANPSLRYRIADNVRKNNSMLERLCAGSWFWEHNMADDGEDRYLW